MQKQAINPALLRTITGALLGGGAGFVHGYYGSPKVLKYEDIPAARNFSAFIDTLTGAAVGAAGGAGKINLSKLTPKHIFTGASVYGTGQILPVLQATMARQREAAMAQADAARAQANSATTLSIPYNLERFATSNLGKGLAGGAAVAGLGGLLSGLLRRRSEEEEMRGRGRMSMVGGDMLKFLLPAMAAGGILGSLKQQPGTPA